MAEEEGDFERAWDLYEQVRTMSEGEGSYNPAFRYLARLAFRRDDRDTARELLHQAITANPQDAHSFHLLAKIYLERGDDPEIAESLARQSVHLKPDAPAFWEVLITALEQQGKTEEASQTWLDGYKALGKSVFLTRLEDLYLSTGSLSIEVKR